MIDSEAAVRVDPEQGFFSGSSALEHELRNVSSQTLNVKLLCTDNRQYHVQPRDAVIRPQQCVKLLVMRRAPDRETNPTDDRQHLVIEYWPSTLNTRPNKPDQLRINLIPIDKQNKLKL